MPLLQLLRPTLPILIGASLMLSLSMGLRQSLGIFLQPLTHGVGISVSDFTLAIAVQNLAWGFLQPFAGAFTVRFGFRAVMMTGAVLYIAGLSLMAGAQGFVSVLLGAGVLIGMSLACTAAATGSSGQSWAAGASTRGCGFATASATGGGLLAAIGAVPGPRRVSSRLSCASSNCNRLSSPQPNPTTAPTTRPQNRLLTLPSQ